MKQNALTPDQAIALERLPLDGKPNRLGLALAISDITQTDLAGETGFTQPYISAVMNGRYQTITVENARKFAEFFGVSIETLFPLVRREEVA